MVLLCDNGQHERESKSMRVVKSVFKWILRIIGALFLLVICLYIISPIKNDSVAKDVVSEIRNTPLPDDTKYVDEYCEAGKLCGNGNGMQYFGAMLIQSDLSLDELKAYYDKIDSREWYYEIAPQDGTEIMQIETKTVHFDGDISGDDYFIVYTWGDYDGIASEFDLRGF